MNIAAYRTIAKIWNQSKCPTKNKQTKVHTHGDAHTLEYYAVLKKKISCNLLSLDETRVKFTRVKLVRGKHLIGNDLSHLWDLMIHSKVAQRDKIAHGETHLHN